MKALIIDDDRNFCKFLTEFLELLEYKVDYSLSPEDGIGKVKKDKSYDIVFIDYKFENSRMTGADLGLKIRDISPISALILITAYGEDHIKDFIYVGFDNYIAKYKEGIGEDFTKMQDEYISCFEVAILNSKKRYKSEFSKEELLIVLQRMNYLKKAVEETDHITQKSLAEKVKGLMIKDQKEGKIPQTVKIPNSYSAHSGFFQLTPSYKKIDGKRIMVEKTDYLLNALKVRQILNEDFGYWSELVASYEPLKKIKKEFDIS